MARLISMPVGLVPCAMTMLSGPETVGASSGTSIGDFTQSVASPFGGWAFEFTFPVSKDRAFRHYRGWAAALHGGANATRVAFADPDMMSLLESGVAATPAQVRDGVAWSNGKGFSNGKGWKPSAPKVRLAASAAKDSTIVKLANSHWGRKAGWGTYLGFFPFYLGMHVITEDRGGGEYRVWPPLRKALTTNHYASLDPVLAMRPLNKGAVSLSRALAFAPEKTVSLIEVRDDDVREFFAD